MLFHSTCWMSTFNLWYWIAFRHSTLTQTFTRRGVNLSCAEAFDKSMYVWSESQHRKQTNNVYQERLEWKNGQLVFPRLAFTRQRGAKDGCIMRTGRQTRRSKFNPGKVAYLTHVLVRYCILWMQIGLSFPGPWSEPPTGGTDLYTEIVLN